jgi:hypothetical protein
MASTIMCARGVGGISCVWIHIHGGTEDARGCGASPADTAGSGFPLDDLYRIFGPDHHKVAHI